VNASAVVLIGATLVVAVGDWLAVLRSIKQLEYLCKPLTMVVLIAAALALDVTDPTARTFFVVALVFSLVGDVFLMLPNDSLFVFGLASFLLGHVAYIAGMWSAGIDAGWLAIGAVVVLVAVASLGRRIYQAVKAVEPTLAAPVAAYIGVISVMVASAFGRHTLAAVLGAGLFYASDALIAWNRFIAAQTWGRLAIIVSYHLGQVGLVLSLAR
jgi:uncharacterized membrane protein YhhN